MNDAQRDTLFKLYFSSLAEDAYTTAVHNGFHQNPPNVPEKVALIHSEVSELLEAHRSDPMARDQHCPEFLNMEIEAADIVIRVMDLCRSQGLDLAGAIVAKNNFNKTRGYKHGKAY